MTLTKCLVPICLYCLNCTKFGQLVFRKIIKVVATRCQILRLKCTKFNFGWGSAPEPAGGAYNTLLGPLAGFKGPTSKGREEEGKEGTGGEGKGKEGTGGEGIALSEILNTSLPLHVCCRKSCALQILKTSRLRVVFAFKSEFIP